MTVRNLIPEALLPCTPLGPSRLLQNVDVVMIPVQGDAYRSCDCIGGGYEPLVFNPVLSGPVPFDPALF
jgi:hypothetical protein